MRGLVGCPSIEDEADDVPLLLRCHDVITQSAPLSFTSQGREAAHTDSTVAILHRGSVKVLYQMRHLPSAPHGDRATTQSCHGHLHHLLLSLRPCLDLVSLE